MCAAINDSTVDVSKKGAALAAAAGDFAHLPIFDRAIECSSRERIRAIQLEKLIAQVEWTYERVPWYRQRMDEMGVSPRDIRTLEDVRKLPFTDKSVLRDTFPYGLFAVPLDEVVELHASSGTTGKPIVVGYNKYDMGVWSDCIARLSQMAGVVPSDRVQMAFGYGMFTGGFGLHYGLQKLGCMMIPAGSGNTERQIQMIQDYGTTVLVATPTYALHICEVGEKMGYDWASSTLRVGLFGGEPCPPGLKAEIESRMHIVCTDNYGLTEVMGPGVSGECLANRDMQHIAEDHFLWEVVDPKTGEPVPEGEMGELVLTPLDKQAIPVLRYRTHDLTRVVTEPCACGRTHGAHAEGALAQRRHAHHPRHQRLPEPGGGRPVEHRGHHPALPHHRRGGRRPRPHDGADRDQARDLLGLVRGDGPLPRVGRREAQERAAGRRARPARGAGRHRTHDRQGQARRGSPQVALRLQARNGVRFAHERFVARSRRQTRGG